MYCVSRWLVALILIGVFITVSIAGADTPATAPAESHAEWVYGVLKRISAIPHGTTRKDFEKTFTMDGGLNGVSAQRYCFRDAQCIKVDATFETPAGSKRMFDDPDATLTHLSKPYLEYPYAD